MKRTRVLCDRIEPGYSQPDGEGSLLVEAWPDVARLQLDDGIELLVDREVLLAAISLEPVELGAA